MFHADFLFTEKDLGDVHRFVASIRAFEVNIRPAVNAKPGKRGQAVEVIPGGGTMADQVAVLLRQNHQPGDKIIRKTIFIEARSLGYKPNSTLTQSLLKARVIKKQARGQFLVLPQHGGKLLLTGPSK